MADYRERNTADSLEQGARRTLQGPKQAINMGKKARRSAKRTADAVKKINGGAGKEVAKSLFNSPASVKVILLVLVPFLLLILLFSYALPNAVYTAVQLLYGDTIKNDYEKNLYAYGSLEAGILAGSLEVGSDILSIARQNEAIDSFLTSIEETMAKEEDALPTADDFSVIDSEESEISTTERYLRVTAGKIDVRQQQIYNRLVASEDDIKAYFKQRFDEEYAGKTFVNDSGETVSYSFGNAQVIISVAPVNTRSAATLLSLYSVQQGTSIDNMQEMSYQKWLGYSEIINSIADAWSGDDPHVDFKVGGQVLIEGPIRWTGEYLPQYLYEQRKYEVLKYGNGKDETLTDYYCLYGSAAIDTFIVVQAEDFATLAPQVSPSGRVSWTVRIRVGQRDAESLAKVVGFTEAPKFEGD